MRIFITRHGETKENREGIITGHLPGSLSAEGIEQVMQLSQRIKNYTFAAMYSSDLYRAVVTAQIIAAYHEHVAPSYFHTLREMDFGEYTGKRAEEVNWERVPQGGETLEAVKKRAELFLETALVGKFSSDANILIISHHLFINAFTAVITGNAAEQINKLHYLLPATLNIFELDDKGCLEEVIALNAR